MVCVLNHRASKYVRQKLIDLLGEIDELTVIVRDIFPFSKIGIMLVATQQDECEESVRS